MIKTAKLLIPLKLDDVKNFSSKKLDFIVITNKIEIIYYCMKNNIICYEYSEIVNNDLYRKIDILEKTKAFCKKNSEVDLKYSQVLKYKLSHVLKVIYLSQLIYDSINEKIDFDSIHINYNSLKLPFQRSNLHNLLNLILSLKFKKYSKIHFFKDLKLSLVLILTCLLNFFSELLLFSEFVIYKILYSKVQYKKKQSNKKTLLFISGGRDFAFHSLISKNLKNYNLVCLKGESKFNRYDNNEFDKIINLQNSLLNGFFLNKIKCNYDSNFIKNNILYNLDSNVLKLILSNYFLFRIKRDYKFINSVAHTIKKINPVLVYSSSLSLPLISACFLKIKTISEFEGFGIDHNPMAPYVGDYIFSPGSFSSLQIKNYSESKSKIINNGAYYL